MKDEGTNLFHVLILFSSLSLLSIGGGNTVIPEMHRKAVEVAQEDCCKDLQPPIQEIHIQLQ